MFPDKFSQDVYPALKDYGLTDYETRAFIALITTGISSAKQLSERTKIPYSRIYDVLVNLEKIGWINVINGRPMKYQALRPKSVAVIAKQEIEEKYVRLEKVLIDELEPPYEKEEEEQATPIWMITGNISKKIMEINDYVEDNITILLKNPNEQIIQTIMETLIAATDKKQIRVFVAIEKANMKTPIMDKKLWRKFSSLAEIYLVKHVLNDSIIVDNERMIIFLSSFIKPDVSIDDTIFIVNSEVLINHTKQYNNVMIRNGEKFDHKKYI